MTMTASTKLKKNKLPKFNADQYDQLPAADLVVFAVQTLIEQKVVISLENVVSACFLLFPHKFALKNYVKWPDSATVHRRWADARAKGLISGTPEDGYKVTFKGTRAAEKTAKALGTFKEKPKQKKAQPAAKPLKPKSAPKKAKPEKKAPSKVKSVSKPPVKKQAPVKQRPIVQESKKAGRKSVKPVAVKTKPVQKAEAVKPQTVKKTAVKPKVKAQIIESAAEKVPVKPIKPKVRVEAVKKVESAPRKKQTQKAEAAQPVQLSLLAEPPAKLKGKTAPPKPVLKESPPAPPPVKKAEPAPAATREEKDRAAKFVKAMERSDAYHLYKSKGKKAVISEFDFRSLLLCTMESSAETLARNLNTFKNYANIQNRKDLVAFLEECETKFAPLLTGGRKKK